MTTSELIKVLQKSLADHGDLTVVYNNNEADEFDDINVVGKLDEFVLLMSNDYVHNKVDPVELSVN